MPTSPPHNDTQAEAADWLARRHGGECGSEEQHRFLRWLNASEANRAAYEEAEVLWQEMSGLESLAARQLSEARAHLAQARLARRRIWRYALAASLAGVLAWNLGWLDFAGEQNYRTALGEQRTVMLADGSQLDLDTNSEVAVRYSRHSRELTLLRGQAAFKVVHEADRPFEVLAENGRIHDIGTQFTVRRYPERVDVTVLEGVVEVAAEQSQQVLPLHHGERLSYTRQGKLSAVEAVDVASVGAWREGKLVFRGQPLGEVIAELGRYHSASLTVNSPRVMAIKVSGAFPTNDLALALDTIAATLPVKLTQTGSQSWWLDAR